MTVKRLFLTAVALLAQFSGLSAITVDNGGTRGDWGVRHMCPWGSYAYGFSIQVEAYQGMAGDDTALNGIRLLCKGSQNKDKEIESAGGWGYWTTPQVCSYGRLTSFQLRVEPSQTMTLDNTAANNIRFHCTDGSVLEGDGMDWGSWGQWSQICPSGICGLQTKVDLSISFDITGLNDVVMFCCHNL